MIEFASDLESAVKTAEFFGDDPMMVSGALVIECAERLAAQDALIEQQAKEIEALQSLLSDIKSFEVDSGVERIKNGEPAFILPLALRKRMQAGLDNAEQTGQ